MELATLSSEERKALMGKPVEEWDIEELAKGRPRSKNGQFNGMRPTWITTEVHEKTMDRFKELVRSDLNSVTVKATQVLGDLLDNDNVDERGRPEVPWGVKADVSKFLIEHLLGKPKQEVTADISVKLQGVLAAALVMPEDLTSGYIPSSSHRDVVDADIEEEEDVADAG